MLIDTHSHLYDAAFDKDREQVLDRALQAGVGPIMLPAIDSTSHEAMFSLARQEPRCMPMMGLHPTSMNENPRWREELAAVEKYLENPPQGIARFYGVGETGIDMHWNRDFLAEQTEAFERQIELALRYDLPLVIHARDAWPEIFAVLEKYRHRGVRGIFHAFSGGIKEYLGVCGMGDFAIGITGVATYKKRPLDEVIRAADPRHIVLETDAPYLTPEPLRGTRNESARIPLIRDCVAAARGVPPEEIEHITTQNAKRIFGI